MKTKINDVIEFLKNIKWTSKVEINRNANSVVRLKEAYWKEQCFFVAWLGERSNKRCSDKDIKSKKYFVIDIDIRLDYLNKHNKVLIQDKLDNEADIIIWLLETNWYGDYSYVVNTWNWIHIYYIWDEKEYDKKIYSLWIHKILDEVDAILIDTPYSADAAVSNIARLSRLPWTYNPRKKIKTEVVVDSDWNVVYGDIETRKIKRVNTQLFDLWNYECIIKTSIPRYSVHPWRITLLGETEYKDIIKREQAKQEEYSKRYINHTGEEDEMTAICEIPLDNIICEEFWFWRKWNRWFFYWPSKKEAQGLLYHEDVNMVTHKWCSAWQWWEVDKTYNTFSYIRTKRNLSKRDAFKWFEDKYKYIKEIWDRDRKIRWLEQAKAIENNKPDIVIPQIDKPIIPEWFVFPNKVFDELWSLQTGELITILASSHSGKTTFALDILNANSKRWKKWFYINLEFPIETMRQSRRLYLNWKKKKHLNDIDPMSTEDRSRMDEYIKHNLSKFDYLDNPWWIELDKLIKHIISKAQEWYKLIVVDSFSKISDKLSKNEYEMQKKIMLKLQELVQWLQIAIIILHHTNKWGQAAWTQKIFDDSNVYIEISKEEDNLMSEYRTFSLKKDKITNSIDIEVYYINHEYVSVENHNKSSIAMFNESLSPF